MSLLRNIDDFLHWDERKQQYVPNYWRRDVLPSWLGFDPADLQAPNGVATVAAAGAPTTPVGFAQPYWSVEGLDQNLGTPFEVRSLVFEDSTDTTAAANFTVRLKENGETREFMNEPVHIRCIAGTAQLPALMREPYFLRSSHKISAQFNKVAGGAVAIRMFLVGAEYYPWDPGFLQYPNNKTVLVDLIKRWMERSKYVMPYWLVPTADVNVLANATNTFFLKVGDDGHFEAFTLTSISTGNYEWELSDPKTQQTIMNGLVTATNGLGDALFPTLLPTPYLVASGHRLRLTITDLSGAPNRIFFTMCGRKIFAPMKDIGDVMMDTSVRTPADVPSQIVPQPLV